MFFGLLLILLGFFLLISQIIEIRFFYLLVHFWPILLILYGIIRLFQPHKSKKSSCLIIFLGLIFQAGSLGIIKGSVFLVLFGIMLIVLGMASIFDVNKAKNNNYYWNNTEDYNQDFSYYEKDMINDRFLFTQDKRVYQSNSFSGGELEAYFSAVTIDLKNVWPLENEIHMNCHVYFSTLTVDVPTDWHVIVDGKHYYAKNEDLDSPKSGNTLVLHTEVLFGNVKIS